MDLRFHPRSTPALDDINNLMQLPGSLSRPSGGQRALGAGGRPPTISEMYATLRSAQRQQQAVQRGGIPPRRPGGSGRTDPGGTGREPGGSGSSLGSTAAPRVLGVPSGSLRRGSGLGMGVSASMPSLSGISHAPSWGAASEMSSISSLRQASEDWGAASSVGGDSQHYYGGLGNGLVSASGAFHSGGMDLAAIDETGSAASLSEELNEKNRIIERLEVRRFAGAACLGLPSICCSSPAGDASSYAACLLLLLARTCDCWLAAFAITHHLSLSSA